jgi:hypothetical protein
MTSSNQTSPAPFRFNATTFVRAGAEFDPGEWADETKGEIAILRSFYPELAHWGDLAIGRAFGDYSQDYLEVQWAFGMLEGRDESFLDYCCWRQTRGDWVGGIDEDRVTQASEWRETSQNA